jgi:hypothetical protein
MAQPSCGIRASGIANKFSSERYTVGFNGDANELSKAEWPTNAALVVPVGEGAFHDKVLEHTWPTISTRPQGEGRSILCDLKDAVLSKR